MATTNFHEQVAELVELAGIYAMDGALLTAAARLRQAADIYEHNAKLSAAFIAHLSEKENG